MTHLFRFQAIAFLALAVNWASVDEWAHSAFTALAGGVCYAFGERFEADRR